MKRRTVVMILTGAVIILAAGIVIQSLSLSSPEPAPSSSIITASVTSIEKTESGYQLQTKTVGGGTVVQYSDVSIVALDDDCTVLDRHELGSGTVSELLWNHTLETSEPPEYIIYTVGGVNSSYEVDVTIKNSRLNASATGVRYDTYEKTFNEDNETLVYDPLPDEVDTRCESLIFRRE